MASRSDSVRVDAGAWSSSFAEAVERADPAGRLPHDILQRLSGELASRGAFARPRVITTSRRVCPECSSQLYQASVAAKRDPKAVCWIMTEPAAFKVTHVPKWCKQCHQRRPAPAAFVGVGRRRAPLYWCGFVAHPALGTTRDFYKVLDAPCLHEDFWLLNKSFGVSIAWLRRWRYRLFLQRASFQSEAMLFRLMQGGDVLASTRTLLSDSWVRYILWQRACEAGEVVREKTAQLLLRDSVEALIAKCWHWYSPLMQGRRAKQWVASGDRDDVLAIDGNAKLHRRTCGMPFAETVRCEALGVFLLRGCPCRPRGTETLCQRHACARDSQPDDGSAEVSAHRLIRALHKQPSMHLQVQLKGFQKRWQPACTVPEEKLAKYFAVRSHARIEERRKRRVAFRALRLLGRQGHRREPTFMASWSSAAPKEQSECGTHKESEAHVTGAARTAGFLTAVSASGIIVDLDELIGAESLSQRYRFLGAVASRAPSLKVVVHDDACHLRLMAESMRDESPLAKRLACDVRYIVDEFHASGHVGAWCKAHCLPSLPANRALLQGFPNPEAMPSFPTSICEVVNSELSPLGHTIHHQGRWVCQLVVNEIADVHNLKRLRDTRDRAAVAKRKAALATRRAEGARAEKRRRQQGRSEDAARGDEADV